MDTSCQLKDQNISTLIQGMKANSNVIKFTQLFISISVFSFVFSPSSLFVFLHYFKFYFSTLPFQLFTHNIDKNSMFLLSNALLVLVGVTKSFSSTSCDSDDDQPSNNSEVLSSSQYVKEEEDYSQCHIFDVEVNEPMLEREPENTTSGPNDKNAAAEEEKVEENIENIILTDEGQGEEMKEQEENEEVELFDEDDEEGDKGSEIDYVPIEENNIEKEEDYVEEEESNRLSTEELNKKFEDFIRKMKEDLRIVARRNLVMV
ncbi:unnamed protein product [Vicia faba]|uniref:Uncharacterized protein n=1 Tax=Vicia faba TaxID=3906 RepID=A0AAV0YMQ0_VICFA|nr:unnamed protein product [Vicia faba]